MPRDLPDWVQGNNSASQLVGAAVLSFGPLVLTVAAYQTILVRLTCSAGFNPDFAVKVEWLLDNTSLTVTETLYLTCKASALSKGANWELPVRGGAVRLTGVSGVSAVVGTVYGSPVPIDALCVKPDATGGRDMSASGVFVAGTPVIFQPADGLGQDVTLNGDVSIAASANVIGNFYILYVDAAGNSKFIFTQTLAVAGSVNYRTVFPRQSVNYVFIPSAGSGAGSALANLQPIEAGK